MAFAGVIAISLFTKNTNMVQADYDALKQFLDLKLIDGLFDEITLHSPSPEQIELFNEYFDNVKVIEIRDWDILDPPTFTTDLLFFCMVFHYIDQPQRAIENIKKASKMVIIQDLIYRDRSGRGLELHGDDRDIMRYSYKTDLAKLPTAYDLTYLNPIYYNSYMDDVSKHFIMLF